ncbi:hypothetical protein BaRGS_00015621 [Batillaria attramentaria]|uniref:Uncharacterized protein n=1 Tax=Batillaria attramentaria TaxID=370345 RepID=A0ABD0L0X1_9CAEN
MNRTSKRTPPRSLIMHVQCVPMWRATTEIAAPSVSYFRRCLLRSKLFSHSVLWARGTSSCLLRSRLRGAVSCSHTLSFGPPALVSVCSAPDSGAQEAVLSLCPLGPRH